METVPAAGEAAGEAALVELVEPADAGAGSAVGADAAAAAAEPAIAADVVAAAAAVGDEPTVFRTKKRGKLSASACNPIRAQELQLPMQCHA